MMRVVSWVSACSISFNCTSQEYQSCTARLLELSLLADAIGRRGHGKDAPKATFHHTVGRDFPICAGTNTEKQGCRSEDLISPHPSRRNACFIWLYSFFRCFAITTRCTARSQRCIIAAISDHIKTCPRIQRFRYTAPLPGPSLPSRRLCTITRPSQSSVSHNHQTISITRPLQSPDPHNHTFAITGCSRSNTSHRVLGFPHFWSPVVC